MVLILLATLLVLGIAFYQAVHGLFSALIMTVLTILCAAVAFKYYEPLASLVIARQPAHAQAISLIAMFVIPLLALRLVMDRLIPGNVVIGAWPDRIIGGALGLITGMICTGILTISIQMLPTGPRWLTYRPFNDGLQREQALWPFCPDEFTIGLVDMLSGGAFQGEQRFSHVHDNLLLELWCARNEANQLRDAGDGMVAERVGRMDAVPGSVTVKACFEPNDPPWRDKVPPDPLMGDRRSKILIIRVAVDESARDSDNWWRLPATHFRLAAWKDKTRTALVSHYPVAYLTGIESNQDSSGRTTRGTTASWQLFPAAVEQKDKTGYAQIGRLMVVRPLEAGITYKKEGDSVWRQLVIDWVFRIGRDETPELLVFRRAAEHQVPVAKSGMPDPKPALDRVVKR